MHCVPQPDNMLMRPYDPMGTCLLAAGDAKQIIRSLLLRAGRRAATTLAPNLTLCALAYNLIANAALYLFYQLTPYSVTLQAFNRDVLWPWGL